MTASAGLPPVTRATMIAATTGKMRLGQQNQAMGYVSQAPPLRPKDGDSKVPLLCEQDGSRKKPHPSPRVVSVWMRTSFSFLVRAKLTTGYSEDSSILRRGSETSDEKKTLPFCIVP